MVLYCTDSFIIILPSSRYDLNNIENDVTHNRHHLELSWSSSYWEFIVRRYSLNISVASWKHTHIILTLLNPTFYRKTGVYRGIHYFFLFLLKNIDCGYSLEPPRRGGSNECTESMFWAEIWKISEFLSENFQFLVVKFSIYLNRRVFVMKGLEV